MQATTTLREGREFEPRRPLQVEEWKGPGRKTRSSCLVGPIGHGRLFVAFAQMRLDRTSLAS